MSVTLHISLDDVKIEVFYESVPKTAETVAVLRPSLPTWLDPTSSTDKDCLRLAALFEIMSRRERCRAKIIRSIVGLANAMPPDSPFMTYNHESHLHQLNAVAFLNDIRPTGHYWIGMAYCLATEQVVGDAPPRYTVECGS